MARYDQKSGIADVLGSSSVIRFCFVAEGSGTARLRGASRDVGSLARGAELMEYDLW